MSTPKTLTFDATVGLLNFPKPAPAPTIDIDEVRRRLAEQEFTSSLDGFAQVFSMMRAILDENDRLAARVAQLETAPGVPAAAAKAPDVLTHDQTERLLAAVLDNDDFRAFTLTELPDIHEKFAYSTTRAARTKVLLDRLNPEGVLAALRRFLPDTTDRCLRDILAGR